MDDTLGFNEQEKKVSDEWFLADTEGSAISVSSRLLQQNYDLKLIRKKDIQSDRPVVQATTWERLAYYRGYATCPMKTQFLCMQQESFKTYLWFYLSNVFCKTLTSTYVYAFFSTYAPDSHFFISKILPVAYGSTFAFIFTALLELIIFTQTTSLYLDYFIKGIFYNSPWNKCSGPYFYKDRELKCYEAKEFPQQFINKTISFNISVYVAPNGEYFQMAPMIHYVLCNQKMNVCNNYFCLYFVILWIGAALCYRSFFKRYLWQVLNVSQMALIFMLFVSFVHLSISYFEQGLKKYPSYGEEVIGMLKVADIDLLSESMTAPPTIHILSSRSVGEIKPIKDSAVIVTSNAIFYLFRGCVSYLLKVYCDNMMKASLQDSIYSPLTLFYVWPIYFSQLYLGDLFGIFFFGLNFINEYFVIIITFQCLTEAILSEWRCLKPWMVIICLILVGITLFIINLLALIVCLYYFCTAVATLMEVIIIFYLYPLGRLLDDVTFFSGVRPTKLRVLTFWITPVYYAIKFYVLIRAYFQTLELTAIPKKYPFYRVLIYFLAIPMFIGALYAIYRYVFKLKMGWEQLFKPLPNWGPRDFVTRRLRKQYDSRVYIGSRAPRDLSRFLFEKADLNAYKLDIRYESMSRRSSLQRGELHLEHEKSL